MPINIQTEKRPPARDYIPTLDGWRSIAVGGVLISHGAASVLLSGRWLPYAVYGARGVDVFFGISGFLICTRLLQEEERNGRISLRKFYIRRTFRILPPYFAYLLIVGLLASVGQVHGTLREWVSCLLFFRNYLPHSSADWYTGHFWSLAIEEHFYLLWPGLLVFWGSTRAKSRVVAFALLIAVWRLIDFRYHLFDRILAGVGMYDRTDIRLDGLLWGCCAALTFAWLRTLRLWTHAATFPLLACAFLACIVWNPPLQLLWQSMLIPAMLLATVLRPNGFVGRVLETAPLRWMGRLSYSLYLWQELFLVGSGPGAAYPLDYLQQWPIKILSVFAAGAASYYLIERPMVRAGHQMTKAPPARPDEAPVAAPVALSGGSDRL